MEVSKTITISGTELAPELKPDAKVGAQSRQLTCFKCFACPAWVTAHRMNIIVQEARPVKTVKDSVG